MSDSDQTVPAADNNMSTGINLDGVPSSAPKVEANEPASTVDKEELKGLLHEIVKDIHSDKTSDEATQALVKELNIAKNDFLNTIQKVEETIKKLNLTEEKK